MSLKTRAFLIFPTVLVASWLVVRSLGAAGEVALDDPPLASASDFQEVHDPALARVIARFAEAARAQRR
jgi:hypothetical protein